MSFYRVATEADFEDREMQFVILSPKVRELVDQGTYFHRLAVKLLRADTGFSLCECQKICLEYQAFSQAKQDFNAGATVYTKYLNA